MYLGHSSGRGEFFQLENLEAEEKEEF